MVGFVQSNLIPYHLQPNCILINHLNPICESKYIHYCDKYYFSLENIWAAVNCNLNLVWQIWCHINVRIHLTEGSSKKNPLLHSQALHYYKPSCWFITSPVVLNHRLVTVETYASCHQSSAATDTLLLHEVFGDVGKQPLPKRPSGYAYCHQSSAGTDTPTLEVLGF